MRERTRLDRLLVDRGLCASREQAQRLVLTGRVRVDGRPATKPGRPFPDDAAVTVEAGARFVSRGGEKLEAALEAFGVAVAGRTAVDVGASTGGFTDCLLQRGAARVYAVDVGAGQLHWRLRQDPRVVVREKTNARYLAREEFPDRPDLAVVDVSFISLTKILPALTGILARPADIVTLIKPQFEAGRTQVGKGGVVRDPAVRQAVIDAVRSFGVEKLALTWQGVCESPIRGPAGNVEYLAWWTTA